MRLSCDICGVWLEDTDSVFTHKDAPGRYCSEICLRREEGCEQLPGAMMLAEPVYRVLFDLLMDDRIAAYRERE